jgi:hypothetical protein
VNDHACPSLKEVLIHDCGTGICVADHAGGTCVDSCIRDCQEAGIVATGHSESTFLNNVNPHNTASHMPFTPCRSHHFTPI